MLLVFHRVQDHVVSQWVDQTLGRKAAITDVGAALQQVSHVAATCLVH